MRGGDERGVDGILMRGDRAGPDRDRVGEQPLVAGLVERVAEQADVGVGNSVRKSPGRRHVLRPEQHVLVRTGPAHGVEHRLDDTRVLGVDRDAQPDGTRHVQRLVSVGTRSRRKRESFDHRTSHGTCWIRPSQGS